VKHTKNEQITLINRTKDKAEKLAGKLNLIVKIIQSCISNYKSRCCNSGHRRSKSYCRQSNFESEKAFVDFRFIHTKNVNQDVEELDGVTLIHMDYLSQLTDETLENRKKHIPAAEAIIEEIKEEFNVWTKKICTYHPCIEGQIECYKKSELDFQSRKISDFNLEQAEIISAKLSKITTHLPII
jgi:glutamyl-tRNA reductase